MANKAPQETQLLETFDALRKAMFSNDVEALEALIADDYVGYDPQGNPQDKKLAVEAYQPGCATLDKYDVGQLEVRVLGEVGIMTGKGYIHGQFAGAEFEHHPRFMDVYVYRAERWQLYLAQVTPMEAA